MTEPTRTHDPSRTPDAVAPSTASAFTPAPDSTASGGDPDGTFSADAAAEQEDAVLAGRYRLRKQIGEGGMGTVWLAEQTEPVRRFVAVKVIKGGTDSAVVLGRFEAERQALALMDHPNIARVLDGGATDRGQPFFVMELVKGGTLAKFCDDHGLGVRQRLELFEPICKAVQHAHQKGVIHRDLKPGNVLVEVVDGKPVPKVIDFGLAKAVTAVPLTAAAVHTRAGSVLGTPPYMAPEQVSADGADVDTRADVYALGVILYELLTGTTPIEKSRFGKLPLDEVVRLIREEEPPTPSTRLAEVRATDPGTRFGRGPRTAGFQDLDWIVMKAIAKERERRYETANGLAADVRRYLDNEPVLARPPTAGYKLRKFVRRNRPQVIAGGLVLAALVAGVVGTTAGLVEARTQRDAADLARRDEEAQRIEAEKQAAEAKVQRDRAVTAEGQATARLADVQAEKARADQERRVAASLNEFYLKSVIGQTAVETQIELKATVSPNLTLREAVDRAAVRLDGRFPGQPLVEAEIRFAVAEAYLHLGVAGKAVPHAERCIALRTQAVGAGDLNTVAAEGLLVSALVRDHQPGRAVPLAERVCRRVTDEFGRGDERTLRQYRTLAMAHLEGEDTARAAAVLEENRTLAEKTLARDAEETLTTIDALARVRMVEGRPDRAEKLYADAVKRWAGDKPTPARYLCVSGLAVALLRKNNPAAAEPHARAALVMSAALFGEDHPDTWAVQNSLAVVCRRLQRPKEALPLLRQLHANMSARVGPDSLDTLRVLNNLAVACEEAGDTKAALDLSEQAYRGVVAKYTADHSAALAIADSLGNMRCKFGHPDTGLALLHDTLARKRKSLPVAHPSTDETYHAFILALSGHRRWDEMRRQVLAHVGHARGRLKPDDDTAWIPLLQTAAHMLLDCGGAADAEPLLRDALTRSERKRPGRWPGDILRVHLGRSLLAQGKYAAAEPELLRAREKLSESATQLPAGVKPIAADCGQALVELYERWAKPTEAAAWRKKLDLPERETLPRPRKE